jgi:hypothetical protein
MTAEELFNEKLRLFQYMLMDKGKLFAWLPVKMDNGWAWLRTVDYIRYFDYENRRFSIRYY